MCGTTESARWWSFYGTALEIVGHGGEGDESVLRVLRGFPFEAMPGQAARADLRLVLSAGKDASAAAAGLGRLSGTPVFGVTYWETAKGFCLELAGSWFEVEPAIRCGRMVLHDTFSEQTALAQHNFVLLGLLPLLQSLGFHDLHGAAVAHGPVRCLLLGESGSGKSTAALNLVTEGWNFVSDDALLLRALSSGVDVFAFRREFCLARSVVESRAELSAAAGASPLADQEKCFVAMQRVFARQARPSITPNLVVFLCLTGREQSQLRVLDKPSAFLRLLRQSMSLGVYRHFATQHLRVLRQLVEQCRVLELAAGMDVRDDAALLAAILMEGAQGGAHRVLPRRRGAA